MDTARKFLRDYNVCGNCVHYNPIRKNGLKYSIGKCNVTGRIKQRSNKCKRLFRSTEQMEFNNTWK